MIIMNARGFGMHELSVLLLHMSREMHELPAIRVDEVEPYIDGQLNSLLMPVEVRLKKYKPQDNPNNKRYELVEVRRKDNFLEGEVEVQIPYFDDRD